MEELNCNGRDWKRSLSGAERQAGRNANQIHIPLLIVFFLHSGTSCFALKDWSLAELLRRLGNECRIPLGTRGDTYSMIGQGGNIDLLALGGGIDWTWKRKVR